MYKNLIINYVKNLNKDDLYTFLKNSNLEVNDHDVDIIYNYIKENCRVILDDPLKHINIIKDKIDLSTYNILLNYYEKYKNFI